MALAQFLVIDTINNRQIGPRCGCGYQNALGAGLNMFARIFLAGEYAGSFQRNINAHFFPWQIGGVALGNDFNGFAADI